MGPIAGPVPLLAAGLSVALFVSSRRSAEAHVRIDSALQSLGDRGHRRALVRLAGTAAACDGV